MIQLFSFQPRCKRPDNSIWRVRHKEILLLLLLFAVSPRLFFPPHPPWVLFYCLKFNRTIFFLPQTRCVTFVSFLYQRSFTERWVFDISVGEIIIPKNTWEFLRIVFELPCQIDTVNDLINAASQINASYLINAPPTLLSLY